MATAEGTGSGQVVHLHGPVSRLLTWTPLLRACLWPFDLVGGWMIRASAAQAAERLRAGTS